MGRVVQSLMERVHAPVYASRLRALVRCITPHLQDGDQVLDVGCGFGALGKAILDAPSCPRGVRFKGLERVSRGSALIDGETYDGLTIPFADRTYDVVILADVLHHEADPDRLLRECIRVSRRLLIIKDHQRRGFFARQRLALLDWAANSPYGVPCLYQYRTSSEWAASHRRHSLVVEQELTAMSLYPVGLNWLFGGGLHYFAALRVP